MARKIAVAGTQNGEPWRLAKSLIKLYDQVDEARPNRDHTIGPDGSIGDAAHAARGSASDHNPWVKDGNTGVVTALDISHDPKHGVDTYAFAEHLRQSTDMRIKYVISNGRIFSSQNHPWEWRKYTGSNPHDMHIHISVRELKPLYDLETPWSLGPISTTTPSPGADVPAAPAGAPLLKYGSTGPAVARVQQLLGVVPEFVADTRNIFGRIADAFAGKIRDFPPWFGPRTESAVKDFQRLHGLVADGIVGPYTWRALETSGSKPPTIQVNRNITATIFGGADDFNRSAYTNEVLNDTAYYVALPYRFVGKRPNVMITNRANGATQIAPIMDVGPWNIDDPYWATIDGRPQAESGTDTRGRRTNKAGIDLSPALAKALGISIDAGKGQVDWTFV